MAKKKEKDKPLTITLSEAQLKQREKNGKVLSQVDIGIEPADMENIGDSVGDVNVPLSVTLSNIFTLYSSATVFISVTLKDVNFKKISYAAACEAITKELQWCVYHHMNILIESVGKAPPFKLPDYNNVKSKLLNKGVADISYSTSVKISDAFAEYNGISAGISVTKKNINLKQYSLQEIVDATSSRQVELALRSLNRQVAACGYPPLFEL